MDNSAKSGDVRGGESDGTGNSDTGGDDGGAGNEDNDGGGCHGGCAQ